MRLFHVSEEAGIRRFEPRPAPFWSDLHDDVVWPIDEAHLPNYLLPRECPRVTYRLLWTTSPDDRAKFFTGHNSHVVAISPEWLPRARNCVLFLYELPARSFERLDSSAGYWVSRVPVEADREIELRKPLDEIGRYGAELRVVSDLWAYRDAVVCATVDFSIIRMRRRAEVHHA